MLDADHPREACGVFGVWAPGEQVANLVFYGLYALQHRGQESAGMAVADGRGVLVFKEMGLVSQVFDEATLATLQGHLAIGHTRYSTTGGSRWENAQPAFKTNAAGGGIALAHNGNLTNTAALAASLGLDSAIVELQKAGGKPMRAEDGSVLRNKPLCGSINRVAPSRARDLNTSSRADNSAGLDAITAARTGRGRNVSDRLLARSINSLRERRLAYASTRSI